MMITIEGKTYTELEIAEMAAEQDLLLEAEEERQALTRTTEGRRTLTAERRERLFGPHETEFRDFLRIGKAAIAENRQQAVGTGTAGGYLAPQGFGDRVFDAMAQYDSLFDPDTVTVIETGRGTTVPMPLSDDTAVDAVVVGENTASSEHDAVFDQLLLAAASTWRAGLIKVSMELMDDSGFDIEAYLAQVFAKRFARGIGASLVAVLVAGAASGVSAGASAITPDNLFDLVGSIDEAYLASPRCAWAMRRSTFIYVSKLKDTAGLPVFPVTRGADGEFQLLGFPVEFCPSVAAIGTTNKSVFFGDLSYLVQRRVANSVSIKRFDERFAEAAQVGFDAYLRVSSGFAVASGADSPVKYLVHA